MALLPCKTIITLIEEGNNGMDKDMLNIIRYAARCEAGINTLTILMEDYKNQDRTAIPISTLETIISTINEE